MSAMVPGSPTTRAAVRPRRASSVQVPSPWRSTRSAGKTVTKGFVLNLQRKSTGNHPFRGLRTARQVGRQGAGAVEGERHPVAGITGAEINAGSGRDLADER